MDQFEQAFRTLPDTVIITDAYWYIIDFNRESPFGNLKKGRNLTNYMPDCKTQPRDRYAYGGRVFKRAVSPVSEGGAVDELTGIVSATALMRPTGISDLEVKSLKKKFKDHRFAAKCDRNVIVKGCELLGMDLSEVMALTIEGMKPFADELGLEGSSHDE